MLMRILVENPGLTFTRNMDKKFVEAVRDLLRGCQHAHVVHFLMETLQDFESKSAVDEGIGRLVEMWQKEKAKSKSLYAVSHFSFLVVLSLSLFLSRSFSPKNQPNKTQACC